MMAEWLVITFVFAFIGSLVSAKGTPRMLRWGVASILLAGFSCIWIRHHSLQKRLDTYTQAVIPHLGRPGEFASSDSCRSCHPDQYASWHRSFHRTMTQKASADSIRGSFDAVTLELDGSVYRLSHDGDQFWVNVQQEILSRTPANPASSDAPVPVIAHADEPQPARRRISMVTGSHHMQAYWLDTESGNKQESFPFTYLFEQQRWVPRRSVFLRNPELLSWHQIWNVGCIDCHSTAGQPRQSTPGSFDTRVGELGIACEACHGSGSEHTRLNANPRRRYEKHFQKQGDSSIVNPARLSNRRSSEICGACHSVHAAPDEREWLQNGSRFQPGDDLESKVKVLRRPQSYEQRRSTFWSDGMIRVSGREYNGLLKTACFLKGNMSCLSCHSMHQSSPTNQLAVAMESNHACLQCHESIARALTEHTHHPSESSGSLCYNCHMPYTSYGLLKALRSHQVSSPNVTANHQAGRPNACNLCHLDKTLDWTSQNLHAWYRGPKEDPPAEDKELAASALWLLKGDAGQRALLAWHMGWKPAQDISDPSWFAPYLAVLLDDPYPAVRYIAGRSLRRLPGYSNFEYDYVAPEPELHRSRQRALDLWEALPKAKDKPSLLVGKDGKLDTAAVTALLKERNQRVVELNE